MDEDVVEFVVEDVVEVGNEDVVQLSAGKPPEEDIDEDVERSSRTKM